jgi:autotransporter-associated beta strand protein
VSSDGIIYTTGLFSGTVDFDPGAGTFNLTSAGNADIFISKLDDSGNFIGAWRLGGTGSDNGISIIPGSQGSVITTGIFAGVVDFNFGPQQSFLTSAGGSDVYVAEYYLNSPTDIQLSSNTVQENLPVDSLVGALSTADPDPGEAFTYALVPGKGDADNGLFIIEGDQLKTNAIFDYETKSSYSIRVRTTDCGGQEFEKTFSITIVDQNDPPTTRIWDGGGGDNLWMDPQNWLGDAAPLPGDNLLFPTDAAQKESVNNYAPQTAFQSIIFIGSGYQLSGNAVLFTSGIIDSISDISDNTIAFSTITLYTSQTFDNLNDQGKLVVQSNINLGNSMLKVDGSGNTRIEGDISGNAGIMKIGDGELTLTGINTYSGDTTVAEGELYTGRIGTNGQPASKVEVQTNTKLQADSITTGTLTIGAGATLTIAPIPGGPLAANSALTPLAADALPPTVAQPTTADTIAPSASTDTTTIAPEPLAASTVIAAPTPASSEAASVPAPSDSLSNTVFDAVAAPAEIIADTALPVGLVESTPVKLIDTAINRLPSQSPIYSRLDSTALNKVIEGGQEQYLATRNGNIASKSILDSLSDELPSNMSKYAKHSGTPALNSRQAHIAALQTVVQNSPWNDAYAEVDFDIAQQVRAGKKHAKQIEKAVDAIVAEEDAVPALL